MATYTPNLNLGKPEATDAFSGVRQLFNDNMDILDNGGGNVYGAFIDTNRVITSGNIPQGSSTYTATEDCALLFTILSDSNNSAKIEIDGVKVWEQYDQNGINSFANFLLVRSGQTVTFTQSYSSNGSYKAYGLTQGTNGIFTPIIYSDSERVVGVWRDNKPLYQRTWEFGSSILVSYSSWTNTTVDSSDIENIITVKAKHADGMCFEGIMADPTVSGHTLVGLQTTRNGAEANVKTLTLQYTKISDVAGSGTWNTDGVPTVHYSTAEQVIGTYFGKTLYQKSYSLTGGIAIGSYGHISLPADSIVRRLEGYAYRSNHAVVDKFNGYIANGELFASIRNGDIEYWISNIFNPVEEIEFTVCYTKTTD